MEAEILEQDNITGLQLGAGFFRHRAGTFGDEFDRLAEKFFQFRGHGFERVFLHLLAVGTSEVAHQHDGSAVVEHMLDGR